MWDKAGVSGGARDGAAATADGVEESMEGTGIEAGTGLGTGTGTGLGTGESVTARHENMYRQMTKHVVTRWYRAPELVVYTDGTYDTRVDVWSVGCVFAEFLGMLPHTPDSRYERRALFPGGSCYPLSRGRDGRRHQAGATRDQLNVIFDVMGTPTDEELSKLRTAEARAYIERLPRKAPIDLARRYSAAPSEAIDLLQSFLRFLPEDRITIDEALAHPFFASIRRPADEIMYAEGVLKFSKVSKSEIRQLMTEEIRYYNPSL